MSEKVFKKNDEVILTIDDISDDGSGIGRSDGFIFFVKNALPGDKIKAGVMKVTKSYGFARIIEVIKPSPGRCKAQCKVADKCGGCSLQDYRYEEQLKYKFNKVKNDLIRIGGIPAEETEKILNKIIGMDEPYRYRNKAQYPVRSGKDGKPHAGFFAGHTHSVIESDDCLIEPEINGSILDAVTGWMNRNHIRAYSDETGEGLVRHVLIRHGFTSGECQVNLIINGNRIPDETGLVSALKNVIGDALKSVTLCPNKRRDNVILGDSYRAIYGEGYITDTLVGITFKISPLSFYQVNPVQTEKLYGLARDYAGLTGEEEVLDLYCGIGTISLMLAKKAGHVTGVEIVDRAIKDAKENAKINAITNAEFITGAAEEVIQTMLPGKGSRRTPDVVVVDPPRKGCARSCIDAILTLAPSRVVYVSCDPATLARDIKIFREGGYELKKATPVDMFPHSSHVEVVSLLQRMSNTRERTITLDIEMEDYHRIMNGTEVTLDATEG
ncbi:MAG: 23S rRNA (uracil(1939)-C(5))-methyltransferase RlmD [Lachnospiraceae bacterium]|nr:23S rRNA (uracil(1939)-C(5))-methyltransferase RlmD [Lachnospiraceae bacterium]